MFASRMASRSRSFTVRYERIDLPTSRRCPRSTLRRGSGTTVGVTTLHRRPTGRVAYHHVL
jgi:hypothetical protein